METGSCDEDEVEYALDNPDLLSMIVRTSDQGQPELVRVISSLLMRYGGRSSC